LPFSLQKVDLRAKKVGETDYKSINPSGYVPALRFPDGQLLTEGAVIVQYIADQVPDKQLAPPAGTMARYRLQEWLNFIATELHKGVSPFYNTLAGDDFKTSLKKRISMRWDHLASAIHDKPFLTGERFTIADGYAFYVMRAWQHSVKQDLGPWPALVDYYRRLAARPSIAAALEAEGIRP
jgi:glutathione S-transferase